MLIDAITRVASRGVFLDPEFVEQRFHPERFGELLTRREMEMLRSVAEGLSNQAIAAKHFVAVKTVEKTLTSVFRKLEIDSSETNARVSAVLQFLNRPQSFLRRQGA